MGIRWYLSKIKPNNSLCWDLQLAVNLDNLRKSTSLVSRGLSLKRHPLHHGGTSNPCFCCPALLHPSLISTTCSPSLQGLAHCWCCGLLSYVWLLGTPGTTAHHAPLSMGFSRPEYWSGLPFPFPGESSQPREWTQVSCIAGGFFTLRDQGSPLSFYFK